MTEGAGHESSPLYQHILLVGTKPKIFLGDHGADLLSANLYGWKAHRHHFPDGDAWAQHFYDRFHKFVAAQYGERRNMDWPAMIDGLQLKGKPFGEV